MTALRDPPSSWRWFPAAMIGSLLVVVAVNAVMITIAVRSFPGSAGLDGFDLSRRYDRVLAASAQQAALGWQLRLQAPDGRPVLTLRQADGATLSGATVTAEAERPVGPPSRVVLHLAEAADGTLVAAEALARGQWVVTLSIARDGRTMPATARLVVP